MATVNIGQLMDAAKALRDNPPSAFFVANLNNKLGRFLTEHPNSDIFAVRKEPPPNELGAWAPVCVLTSELQALVTAALGSVGGLPPAETPSGPGLAMDSLQRVMRIPTMAARLADVVRAMLAPQPMTLSGAEAGVMASRAAADVLAEYDRLRGGRVGVAGEWSPKTAERPFGSIAMNDARRAAGPARVELSAKDVQREAIRPSARERELLESLESLDALKAKVKELAAENERLADRNRFLADRSDAHADTARQARDELAQFRTHYNEYREQVRAADAEREKAAAGVGVKVEMDADAAGRAMAEQIAPQVRRLTRCVAEDAELRQVCAALKSRAETAENDRDRWKVIAGQRVDDANRIQGEYAEYRERVPNIAADGSEDERGRALMMEAVRVRGELAREIRAVLAKVPAGYQIEVREGGGPENVAAALAVTVGNLIQSIDAVRKDNDKLAVERDEAIAKLRQNRGTAVAELRERCDRAEESVKSLQTRNDNQSATITNLHQTIDRAIGNLRNLTAANDPSGYGRAALSILNGSVGNLPAVPVTTLYVNTHTRDGVPTVVVSEGVGQTMAEAVHVLRMGEGAKVFRLKTVPGMRLQYSGHEHKPANEQPTQPRSKFRDAADSMSLVEWMGAELEALRQAVYAAGYSIMDAAGIPQLVANEKADADINEYDPDDDDGDDGTPLEETKATDADIIAELRRQCDSLTTANRAQDVKINGLRVLLNFSNLRVRLLYDGWRPGADFDGLLEMSDALQKLTDTAMKQTREIGEGRMAEESRLLAMRAARDAVALLDGSGESVREYDYKLPDGFDGRV